MKTQAGNNLAEALIEQIRRMSEGKRFTTPDVNADTDLLAAGVLDSMGLIELLTFMEVEWGCRVDLLDADPAHFSTIKGLCDLALKDHAEAVRGC